MLIHIFKLTGPAPTIPTITYTVGDRDTLTSVAARFDTTPSELTQLNRLGSSFIYSGQTLLVPDKSKIKDDDSSSETSGDTDVSKDKSRKSSSNNDDIPQQEKGKQGAYICCCAPLGSFWRPRARARKQFTARHVERRIDFVSSCIFLSSVLTVAHARKLLVQVAGDKTYDFLVWRVRM